MQFLHAHTPLEVCAHMCVYACIAFPCGHLSYIFSRSVRTIFIPVIDRSMHLHFPHFSSRSRTSSSIFLHPDRTFPLEKRSLKLRVPRILLHFLSLSLSLSLFLSHSRPLSSSQLPSPSTHTHTLFFSLCVYIHNAYIYLHALVRECLLLLVTSLCLSRVTLRIVG